MHGHVPPGVLARDLPNRDHGFDPRATPFAHYAILDLDVLPVGIDFRPHAMIDQAI
jgi:hypothetical protein